MKPRGIGFGILLGILLSACAGGRGSPLFTPTPGTAPAESGTPSPPNTPEMTGVAPSIPGTPEMPGSEAGAAMAFDAQFIDSMVMHHEGAVTISNMALTAEVRPEVRAMAQEIIETQEAEITQLREWRDLWYPELPPTGGLPMVMAPVPTVPAAGGAYDLWFVDAMIPHHREAIAMAQDALLRAEHPEIREFAETIIATQEGEIAQMEEWQQAWRNP